MRAFRLKAGLQTRTMTMILETERLKLRRLSLDDTEFVLRLLNEPSFIQNIGDRGVRTMDDARGYIVKGPITSYEKFGFGLWMVETRSPIAPIGISGLLKQEALDDAHIAHPLLPHVCFNRLTFPSS